MKHEIIGLVGQYKIILDYELGRIEMSHKPHLCDIKSLNSGKIYLDDLNSFLLEKNWGHFDDKNTDYKIKILNKMTLENF